MRLGMMQPYFFPYLGYFGLIHAADEWVVFDTAQYIRRGWVNRNRVLADGRSPWKYARVPIRRCPVGTAIQCVQIDDAQDWRTEILNNLDAYRRRKAPYFESTRQFLEDTLASSCVSLSELLLHCLQACCCRLNLPFRHRLFSELPLTLPDDVAPGEWALETARQLRADRYVNAPGGRDLFDSQQFAQAEVELSFLQPSLKPYSQGQADFESGLSIIDAFMWNSVDDVREMVADYRLEAA